MLRSSNLRIVFLPVLSGVLLALAFPKFNLFWLAWIALVPLFVALGKARDWRESLLFGFFFGIVFFGLDLYWMFSLYRFVKLWILLGWMGLVLFQTLFALFFALLFRLVVSTFHVGRFDLNPFRAEVAALVGGRRRTFGLSAGLKGIAYAAMAAVLWVFVEWLRAQGPFGVTAGDIGYSQVQLLPLIQIASWVSVYGISFLVVLSNVSLALWAVDFKRWQPLLCSILLIAVSAGYGLYVLYVPNVPTDDHTSPPTSISEVLRRSSSVRTLKLSLIQPSVDQMDKLDPAMVPPIYEIHEKMTRQAVGRDKPEVVVWPESAVFTYLLKDRLLLPRLRELLRETGVWLIVGTPHYVGKKAYNSVASISPAGEIVSRYDKERPVPFGEYLPFRKILYPLLKGVGYYDAEFNGNPDPKLIKVDNIRIAAAVCFESTFPGLIRRRVKMGGDFILVVTNDAWFGNSAAAYQHLNAGILRAIENRKYLIQVGNTGISAVIDPHGRVLKRTGVDRREILTFEIPLS